MTGISTLNDLLSSILERGARLVDWSSAKPVEERPLAELCAKLMGSKGEASGVALAAQILRRYAAADRDERVEFFELLGREYDLEPARVERASSAYRDSPSPDALDELVAAAEPRRQELFRRLNTAPGGTRALVEMRTHLFREMRDRPHLARIDNDFRHLLASWFNRGFLVLAPIDWSASAQVLEKIIAYEAVHEIDSWEELRRRVQPADRRCFAFFHPAMPDEPLIFVEVALSTAIETSIQKVLAPDREILPAGDATTAVFYSISNCQEGLRGVSFGAFLIKQVAEDLARALPRLETFVTLSPVPGFTRWIRETAQADPEHRAAEVAAQLGDLDWIRDEGRAEKLKPLIMGLAAEYLLEAKRAEDARDAGAPIDPVARFHLGNGAELEGVNWAADVSAKGLAQSAGVMVNYLYDLGRVEAHHEDYAADRTVHSSRQVRALLPKT